MAEKGLRGGAARLPACVTSAACCIDTGHVGNPGTIGVFAFRLPAAAALVERPRLHTAAVEAGLEEAGLDPADLRYLLLTHIHLDHGAAAGALLANAPDGKLVVHEVGARHMVDPSRLMASAERVYGAMLGPLWGRMQPVEASRVEAVAGGEIIDLGGRKVTVIATPGHASHHVSYRLDDGTLFTGDSAGVSSAAPASLRPAAAARPRPRGVAGQRGPHAGGEPARLILTTSARWRAAEAAAEHLQQVMDAQPPLEPARARGCGRARVRRGAHGPMQRLED